MTQKERSSRLVVIQPIRDWTCAECGGSGDLLRMDDANGRSRGGPRSLVGGCRRTAPDGGKHPGGDRGEADSLGSLVLTHG